MKFHGQIAYHDFEGSAVDHDENVRVVTDLGGKSILMLRNYGALICARSILMGFYYDVLI